MFSATEGLLRFYVMRIYFLPMLLLPGISPPNLNLSLFIA
jgi:hypothetical protein